MTNNKIINNINELTTYGKTYKSKCRRNLRAFEWSRSINIDSLTDANVVGYNNIGMFAGESDTTTSIQENIIRSCVDTLVSKIASQKVRPYFNTINGTFKDLKIVKAAQQFFDIYYDEKDVVSLVTDTFRNSCIFDKGIIYVDKDTQEICRVLPWQFYVDSKEKTYNKITKCVWKREHYPTSLLPYKTDLKEVTYTKYYDLNEHIEVEYIPELDKLTKKSFDFNVIPFIIIYYSDPIIGNTSSSIVDQLYGIALEIDNLMTKIRDASQLSSPLKFLIPEQSDVKVDKLSNRTGEVIKYTYFNGVPPITVATEPFMDPQWMQTIETLKQHAYELIGISQLSATSQKPKGLDSGVALATMEDIESDRFETQLNNVISAYKDLAKLCLTLFNDDASILPADRWRSDITWHDVKSIYERMSLDFSAAEYLSKDPSEKLKQLQALVAAGVIPQSRMVSLMQLPDLEQGYSIANNSINAVMAIIDRCIEKDDYNIPPYIFNPLLKSEILNTCLSLTSSNLDENKADIDKLMRLYEVALKRDGNAQTTAEMMAVQNLQNEMTADLQNPNGMINSAVNGVVQQNNINNIMTQNQQLQNAAMQGAALQGV